MTITDPWILKFCLASYLWLSLKDKKQSEKTKCARKHGLALLVFDLLSITNGIFYAFSSCVIGCSDTLQREESESRISEIIKHREGQSYTLSVLSLRNAWGHKISKNLICVTKFVKLKQSSAP